MRSHRGGLRQLGVLPLLIPLGFCAALFLIATEGLELPSRNWAILVVVFGALWYLFVWWGIRKASPKREETLETEQAKESRASSGGLARVFRSPGGLLSAILGAGLVLSGDRQLGAILLGAGLILLSLSQIQRR